MTTVATISPIANASARSEASAWAVLYRLSGTAALLQIAIVIVQLVVFMIAPPPLEGTAADWFELFQQNPLIGLIDFELLMVLYALLCIPVALALYTLLRQVSPSWTSIYVVLSLLGVMCFIAARPAFEMLHLSQAYAGAETNAEKAMLLAAGEAKVATFHGTAFYINYILGSLTGLIISLVMLQTSIFNRATAYVRIASSICDFGLFLPAIGMFIAILSVLFLVIWNILVARRLFQLAGTATILNYRADARIARNNNGI
jgi:hypothetical protein